MHTGWSGILARICIMHTTYWLKWYICSYMHYAHYILAEVVYLLIYALCILHTGWSGIFARICIMHTTYWLKWYICSYIHYAHYILASVGIFAHICIMHTTYWLKWYICSYMHYAYYILAEGVWFWIQLEMLKPNPVSGPILHRDLTISESKFIQDLTEILGS